MGPGGGGWGTMTPSEPDESESSVRRSKVGRVIEAYGLAGLAEELERRWLGEGRERQSLRDLANYFNERVLEAAVEAGDEPVVEGEVANYYELLTGEDVSKAVRTQAETKLKRRGVEVKSVKDDFVTHQAVYSYLTKYRDVTPPDTGRSTDESVDSRRETIERLRNRLSAVTATSLRELSKTGAISIGSFDVLVNIQIHCQDCETTSEVGELFESRACECQ